MKIAVAGATGLIGAQLTTLAREEGHDVVELARSTGFDLLQSDGADRLREALTGVEAVVDVTSSADPTGVETFFTTVARNLGQAATGAGVARTVVLSIVGVDRSPDFDYYVAKLAHERATREHAPGPIVLRATQFHEFAGQMLAWNTHDGVVQVMDVPSQPVATGEVVRVLLDLATGALTGDQDLAGPRPERLVDQVRALVDRAGSDVTVEAAPAAPSMAGGSMLPGPGALLRGPDWATWLDQQA